MAAARPPKFKSESDFRDASGAYFDDCEESKTLPLRISRETYKEYRKKYPDAHKEVEDYIDGYSASPSQRRPAIFYLKNAFKDDYQDRQDTDITSGGEPISSLSASDKKAITELRDLLKQQAA
jgi:hypothetical protein